MNTINNVKTWKSKYHVLSLKKDKSIRKKRFLSWLLSFFSMEKLVEILFTHQGAILSKNFKKIFASKL